MTKKRNILIQKSNGEKQVFQAKKLYQSLRRAGAKGREARDIVEHIEAELFDGMSTQSIYKHAFELLKKQKPSRAARYDLKRALMRLGPSGYPFEKFIGKIWEEKGYSVEVGVIKNGFCIEHEVDVVAENKDEIIMMECKYHNMNSTKSDVKTALYVHARMQDLEKKWKRENPNSKKKFKGMLVTNTQFSSMAINYAECVGLEIVSWDYPHHQSLRELIDNSGLHPITCLTSLTEGQVKNILDKGMVLCHQIPKAISKLRIKGNKKEEILKEAGQVCQLTLPEE